MVLPRAAITQPPRTRIDGGGGRRERSTHNPSRSALAQMPAFNPPSNRVQPRAPRALPRAATQVTWSDGVATHVGQRWSPPRTALAVGRHPHARPIRRCCTPRTWPHGMGSPRTTHHAAHTMRPSPTRAACASRPTHAHAAQPPWTPHARSIIGRPFPRTATQVTRSVGVVSRIFLIGGGR